MSRNLLSRAVAVSLKAAPLALVGAGMIAPAFATGDDFSTILTGLDNSTAITAVIGAGVILAGVGFAKWATKKVARFFG